MSTQIFISNSSKTCKPEFTKIAAHSFTFTPNVIDPVLYSGGTLAGQSIWSVTTYDYSNAIFAPVVLEADKNAGIPLPINLVPDDIVTISGTAYFNNVQAYIDENFDVNLVLGVYYFGCRSNDARGFTFIPIESFAFKTNNSLCFETSVTLGSNFDIHDTRFLVGFNIGADCLGPGECIDPIVIETNLATVSYTFDIERPCAATITNFIIRNCCEPIITELVNIPGLTVGSFHVDDEGNCWEVIDSSKDVTNFTRNFVDNYTSCLECQAANGCPDNLKIESCCVQGQEFVSSSLPGLDVGDTFVDNNGLCWRVSDTTGAPITEEFITVGSEIMGDCKVCTTSNPCPDFWYINSCCVKISEIIAAPQGLLMFGDSFVDTNGICWAVSAPVQQLPTNYNIIVDTVYSMTPTPFENNCEQCIFYNPCPLEYFLTVRACCDPDRIEVISVPAEFMYFSEGLIFTDTYNVCWEVMSYSTTGVETYPIDWSMRKPDIFSDCLTCISSRGKAQCTLLYQVRDCVTDEIYTARIVNTLATVGSFYQGLLDTGELEQFLCFEVLGYGYPTVNPLSVFLIPGEYLSCEECTLQTQGNKILEIQSCCGGPTFNINYKGPWTAGIGGVAYLNQFDGFSNFIGRACYTLIGLSLGPVIGTDFYNLNQDFSSCSNCLAEYPCG